MGLLSFFGNKPEKKDITAYNYYLYFDYIPKKLYDWEYNRCPFTTVISFDSLIQMNPIWKSLIKKTEVVSSGIIRHPNLMMYLVKGPSTGFIGEVAMAIVAINQLTKKSLYYTLEHSLGSYMICSADEKGNHYNYGACKTTEEFGAFVIKNAIGDL